MLGLHLQKYPIPKWGQKGKTVKYVRAYLEEIEEEGSDRLISSPTERRRRAREDRRETERRREIERESGETDFGILTKGSVSG